MTTINERIMIFIKNKGIKQSEFADLLGISRGYVSDIKSGKSKPGRTVLERIGLCYPDLNMYWLLTGEGDMLNETFSSKNNDDTELQILYLEQTIADLKLENKKLKMEIEKLKSEIVKE